ncbi:MAG: hypothetical protein WDM90_02460 [Ferruginibacter sp.]
MTLKRSDLTPTPSPLGEGTGRLKRRCPYLRRGGENGEDISEDEKEDKVCF